MNYEEMSDFEINKWIWRLTKSPKTMYVSIEYQRVFHDAYENHEFDPCNNPSDAWTIIVENGISINKFCKVDKEWSADVEHPNACDEYNTIEVEHKNPLRAAMICFLKIKDAESKQ